MPTAVPIARSRIPASVAASGRKTRGKYTFDTIWAFSEMLVAAVVTDVDTYVQIRNAVR